MEPYLVRFLFASVIYLPVIVHLKHKEQKMLTWSEFEQSVKNRISPAVDEISLFLANHIFHHSLAQAKAKVQEHLNALPVAPETHETQTPVEQPEQVQV